MPNGKWPGNFSFFPKRFLQVFVQSNRTRPTGMQVEILECARFSISVQRSPLLSNALQENG